VAHASPGVRQFDERSLHELVPEAYIEQVFARMAEADQHEYQILTERPERMAAVIERIYARRRHGPLPNVWLGVSIENDRWVGRADALRQTPAPTHRAKDRRASGGIKQDGAFSMERPICSPLRALVQRL
jgi:hypothetical protein